MAMEFAIQCIKDKMQLCSTTEEQRSILCIGTIRDATTIMRTAPLTISRHAITGRRRLRAGHSETARSPICTVERPTVLFPIVW